jgi:hypothetical protein
MLSCRQMRIPKSNWVSASFVMAVVALLIALASTPGTAVNAKLTSIEAKFIASFLR